MLSHSWTVYTLCTTLGLEHLPGPDAHDIQFSVVSIPQQEGQLLEAVYDEGPAEGGFGRLLEGYMVPINCENSGARCQGSTFQERQWVRELVEGGTVHVHPSATSKELSKEETPIEYLLAHFGTKVQHSDVNLPLVISKPSEACSPLETDVKGENSKKFRITYIVKSSRHIYFLNVQEKLFWFAAERVRSSKRPKTSKTLVLQELS